MVGCTPLWNTATAVASTGVITSKAVSTLHAKGFYSILIIMSAGTTPSIDATYKIGRLEDSATYYTPVDQVGTTLGTINSTSITTDTWITFNVGAVCPWIKIILTGSAANSADTTIRAYLFYQEEMGTDV